jgi:hypothetical protein
MLADIAEKRDALAALCRRYGVTRLEVFGSAARGAGFDPNRSDADFLVTFSPAAATILPPSLISRRRLKIFSADPLISSSVRRSRQAGISSGAARFSAKPKRFMADLPERDAALLLDMLLAARDARNFVEGVDEANFLGSRLHQNATIRSLEIIGEAAGKVSAPTRAAHPEIPWRDQWNAPPSHSRLCGRASGPCLDSASRSHRLTDCGARAAGAQGEARRAVNLRLSTPTCGPHLARAPGCNGKVEYGTNGEGV